MDRRLRKLEAESRPARGEDKFERVGPLAFSKLATSDRDLIREAIAANDVIRFAENNRAVFERWEGAFAAAVREVGLPSHIGVWEMMF